MNPALSQGFTAYNEERYEELLGIRAIVDSGVAGGTPARFVFHQGVECVIESFRATSQIARVGNRSGKEGRKIISA